MNTTPDKLPLTAYRRLRDADFGAPRRNYTDFARGRPDLPVRACYQGFYYYRQMKPLTSQEEQSEAEMQSAPHAAQICDATRACHLLRPSCRAVSLMTFIGHLRCSHFNAMMSRDMMPGVCSRRRLHTLTSGHAELRLAADCLADTAEMREYLTLPFSSHCRCGVHGSPPLFRFF